MRQQVMRLPGRPPDRPGLPASAPQAELWELFAGFGDDASSRQETHRRRLVTVLAMRYRPCDCRIAFLGCNAVANGAEMTD